MAYTTHVFTKFLDSGRLGSMATDPFRVILCNGPYSQVGVGGSTPMTSIQDTAQFVSDVKALVGWSEPITGQGGSDYIYNINSTLSGLAIVAPTWTQLGHVWTWTSATNPTWTTAGPLFNPCIALFFDSIGGTDATNPVVCWWDFGATQIGAGVNYALQIPAGGIITGVGS
jgi:hypothetical protein